MTKLTNFDVLVVYSQKLAISASNKLAITPFAPGSKNYSYNEVYAFFLLTCQNHHLKIAFTTSGDIIGPGFCKSYWIYDSAGWHKKNSVCYSKLIFDKFSPTTLPLIKLRKLLFSNPSIKSFNDPNLYATFFDKQKTFNLLSRHAIPTITLTDHSLAGIKKSCQELVQLTAINSSNNDFGTDIVMKDRFGAGGRHVYKYSANQSQQMLTKIQRHPRISYIIQPFAHFNEGYSHNNKLISADIRLIYLQGKIIQSYIRTAKAGEFRCNEHQGGTLTYIPLTDLPSSLIIKSNLIAANLNQNTSLYSLDFIITNNGNSYLLEGNTGPGLDWNQKLPLNEIHAKNLINLIAQNLSGRVANHLT